MGKYALTERWRLRGCEFLRDGCGRRFRRSGKNEGARRRESPGPKGGDLRRLKEGNAPHFLLRESRCKLRRGTSFATPSV